MLQGYYQESVRLKPSNRPKKKFVNMYVENMTFKEYIKYIVKDGVDDFYKLTADEQAKAIEKYFLEMDETDAIDVFYTRNYLDEENDLCYFIKRKVISTKTRSDETDFLKWLKKRVYERCLPKVQEAIIEAYRWYVERYAEAKGIITEEL